MATQTEITTILKARDETTAVLQRAQRELDRLAAAEKARPVGRRTIEVDVRSVQMAQGRIQELERTLQSWQRVAARGGTITAGDLSQIKAAERELDRLAAAEKARPVGRRTIDVDVRSVQTAQERIKELERTLQSWQRAASRGATITAGDLSQIKAAERELGNLQRSLQAVNRTSVRSVAVGGTGAATASVRNMQRAMQDAEAAGSRMGRAVGGGLAQIDQAAGVAAGGLGGLASAVGAAGLVALTVQAGRAFMELGALGEQVTRSEKYFEAFSGSAGAAAENLVAMREATDGALSTQQAMVAASKLQSMGLANNAQELQTVARMAVLLGGQTRSAAEAVDEFALLLANQSVLRLDTFGISGARVRDRIEELMEATAGLSREQAFMQAVMEEGSRKVQQLEAAGVTAGTAQDRLRAQTEDLRAELSLLTEQPYTVVIQTIIRGVRGLADLAGGANALAGSLSGPAEEQIQGAEERLKVLEDLRRRAAEGENIYRFNAAGNAAEIAAQKERIAWLRLYGDAYTEVRARLDEYLGAAALVGRAQGDLNDALAVGDTGMADIARSALAAAEAQRDAALAAYQAAEGLGLSGVAAQAAAAQYDNAAASSLGLAGAIERANAQRGRSSPLGQMAASAWYSGGSTDFYTAITDNKITEDLRYANELARQREAEKNKQIQTASTAATKAAGAWDAAFQKVSGRISGYLSDAQGALGGLLPDWGGGAGDLAKPGANGPFENIYRAADVAKNGMASPWAAVLGLTPEAAKKIVNDFFAGAITPDVERLINVGGLVDAAKLADQAENLKTQFVTKVSKQAGVGTTVVEALMGMETQAGEKESAATQAVGRAVTAVGSDLQDKVTSAEFQKAAQKSGASAWGHFEGGFIEAAKGSTALQAAIKGMMETFLALRGGGLGGGVAAGAHAGGIIP